VKAWRRVMIGDVCLFLNGGTPSRSVEHFFQGDIPWITGADITSPIVTAARSYITKEAINSSATNHVPAGTVLLVTRTSVGKVATAGIDLCFSQDITALTPDASHLHAPYLVEFLKTQETHLERQARGATIKGITRQVVSDLEIPLPPLTEQRRIAEMLDRAEALRAKRRAALAQLDSLTQSLFFDLFGDPEKNSRGLKKTQLGKLIKLKSGEFLPAENMTQGGEFPVLGGNGINGFHDQFLFEEEQIVIGRVGVYCGCVHVAPKKSWITDNALYVSERSKDVEFGYLIHALTHAKLNRYASQSGQPLVSGSRIYPVEILVPPLASQSKFTRRVESVEKLKAAQRASLSELDALFASLQHRAFRGEL
jgi:type I restriction enzyme S subunit